MQIPPGHISTANPIHGWTIDSHYRYGGVYACAQIPASRARRMGGDLCFLQRQTHPLCRNATTHACIMRRDCPAAEMEQRPGPFEGLVAGDVGVMRLRSGSIRLHPAPRWLAPDGAGWRRMLAPDAGWRRMAPDAGAGWQLAPDAPVSRDSPYDFLHHLAHWPAGPN